MKGIDPKAREIAKDLARRSGMTLGEWLNQVIYDDHADTPPGAPSRRAVARPASENRAPRRSADELERVLSSLQDLSHRFEASLQEQAETSARFDRALIELKADQYKVAERLRTVEQAGGATGGKTETLKALEGALNKVALHLSAGESRHREVMAEMRRELGEEMSRVADQVNHRVLEAENRSADALSQVAAEVTRVATGVDQRLRRADDAQAEALEKLGGEIARITERLSERIAAAERRAAQSVEEVGEQVSRVTDRLHQRQDRSESELAERMRLSEERTVRLLEEARQTIQRRLARQALAAEPGAAAIAAAAAPSVFAARWSPVEVPAPVVRAPLAEPAQSEPGPEAAMDDLRALLLDAETVEEPEADAAPEMDADAWAEEGGEEAADLEAYMPPEAAPLDEVDALEALAEAIHAQDVDEAAEAAEASEETVAFTPPDEPAAAGPEDRDGYGPSTRELIAEAKAAAFASESAFRRPEVEEEQAAAAVFPDLSGRKPRGNGPMRGVLLAGGAVASIGLAATGYVALHPEIVLGAHEAERTPPKAIPVGPPSTSASPAPPAAAPQAAVALAAAPAPATAPSGETDLAALFRDAAAKVDAGDASGVAGLRTAANLGYAPAQRRLGKLYEDGGAGVTKDPAEGRRWTQRAAANGDARGMHNLGLDYYEGVGGIKNVVVAAQWFQRAAHLGLRDSQYNLARFYEAGIGLPRDLAAAYQWYLIAARGGDAEAAARGEALKAKLQAGERTRAEALAVAFRADAAAPAAPTTPTAALAAANPKQLALAKKALMKLGYYRGPDEGVPSQALGEAIQAYQRDRGLAQNGQLSPELVQAFAHVTQ